MKDYMPYIVLGGVGAGLYLYYRHLVSTCLPTDTTGACGLYNSVFGITHAVTPVTAAPGATNPPPPVSLPITQPVQIVSPPAVVMPPVVDQLRQKAIACQAGGGRWDGIAEACISDFFGAPADPVIRQKAITGSQLVQKLMDIGGGPTFTRNVDEWNYLMKQIDPTATVSDLGLRDATTGQTPNLFASQYVDARTSAGLSGFRGNSAMYSSRVPLGLIHGGPRMRFYR